MSTFAGEGPDATRRLTPDEAEIVKSIQAALRPYEVQLEELGLIGQANAIRWARLHLPHLDPEVEPSKGRWVWIGGRRIIIGIEA